MYSQYSYYQNAQSPGNNPQQQQQQQQQTPTSTLGQVWNGQQWVASAAVPVVAYPPPHGPPPPAAAATAMIIKHGKTHAQLVQHYTSYYHMWNEQVSQAKVALASLPPPHPNTPSNNERREEMGRREKWATYYSGNSAALAHYHLALSGGGGGGIGVEPYPRPASPPMPPQMTQQQAAASAVVVAVAAAPVAVAPGGGVAGTGGAGPILGTTTASPATAVVANPMSTSINISPKKKKRWASLEAGGTAASTLLDLEEEAIRRSGGRSNDDDNNNGKSSSKTSSSTKSSSTSSAASAAAAASSSSAGGGTNNNRGDDTSLYLDKFVQETSTSGTKRKHAMVVDRIDDSYSSFSSSSKKRNNVDGGGISYYGPSSSSREEDGDDADDDYVPLGLNRPLGTTTKKEQQQKKKKQQGKNSNNSNSGNNVSGFNADETALSERARRFQGKGGIDSASNTPTTIANVEKYMGKTTIGGSMKQLDESDYERMTVKGTCTVLEKQYLRLTSPPKSELVRPQRILEEHLSQLKRSYYHREKGNNDRVHNGRQRDYSWYCSQMKAIRQDLTVQRIINAFAVDVYETHAKMALEEDDINEYNQSQTQLKELYDLIDRRRQRTNNDGAATGSGGKAKAKAKGGKEMTKKNKKVSNKCGGGKKEEEEEEECADKADYENALKHRNEFIAYRIIYYVFLSGNKKYEGGSSDIFKIMLELTPEQRKDECIHHALLVRAAVADHNYHKFFQLQDIAPNMGDYLMDKIVPSVRQGALQRICKGYRPSVPTNFVLKELGFDVKNKEEVRGGMAWMKNCGCKFEGGSLLTKDTVLTESAAVGAKNSLI